MVPSLNTDLTIFARKTGWILALSQLAEMAVLTSGDIDSYQSTDTCDWHFVLNFVREFYELWRFCKLPIRIISLFQTVLYHIDWVQIRVPMQPWKWSRLGIICHDSALIRTCAFVMRLDLDFVIPITSLSCWKFSFAPCQRSIITVVLLLMSPLKNFLGNGLHGYFYILYFNCVIVSELWPRSLAINDRQVQNHVMKFTKPLRACPAV